MLLVGQSVTTLRATAGKYLAAVAGRHSFTEAVLLRALALLRLIRSKHFYAPPSICLSGWAPAYVPAEFTGICRCQSIFLSWRCKTEYIMMDFAIIVKTEIIKL